MSAACPFAKMEAVGNDFVVVAEESWPAESDWSALAIRLCDRKFGIGSDGLLVIGASSVADVRMLMFNPDGTEDMCGNGLRCVVEYAHANGLVEAAGMIESLDGNHAFRIDERSITTEMLPPRFHLPEIPVDAQILEAQGDAGSTGLGLCIPAPGGSIRVDAINTGSTHAVIFRQDLPDDADFFYWSPLVELSPVFPQRTSVLWAVVETPNRIRLRIWERGVGETLGCGTGACAAAVLANVRGFVDAGPIRVLSRGGELSVYWSAESAEAVHLTGSARIVYSGWVDSDAEN